MVICTGKYKTTECINCVLLSMELDRLTSRYFLGNKPVLVVGKLELVKNIMVKDFNIFPCRRGTDTPNPIMKTNVANVEGSDWRRMRSMTSPAFTSRKLKLIYPIMVKCVNDSLKHLDEFAVTKSNVNLKEIFGNITLNIIALTHFATDLNLRNELDNLFVKNARDCFQINPFKILMLRMMPTFIFDLFGVQASRSSNDSEEFYINFARHILQNRRESGESGNDFLQFLIDAGKSTADDATNEGKTNPFPFPYYLYE